MKKASSDSQACDNCGSSSNGTILMKACSRCRLVHYCSKECQIIHWKSGHKKTCIPINDRRVNNNNVKQHQLESESSQQTNCPICLDCLTNTFCTLPCDHTFHAKCIESLRSQKGLNQVCPLCRTDLPPGPEEAYMRACSLFNKSRDHSNFSTRERKDMFVELFNLLNSSAEEGFMFAQFMLGAFYQKGHEVKQDFVKAREWYLKAASQGHANSKFGLCCIYRLGQGVKQDIVKARECVG